MIDRAALNAGMAAAADGDRAALAPLFHALWPIAVGYATRLVGDRSLAEDCAQDALIQLFGQLTRYDRERDALTWALTLVTWQCRTLRRRRARRGELRASGARAGADAREAEQAVRGVCGPRVSLVLRLRVRRGPRHIVSHVVLLAKVIKGLL